MRPRIALSVFVATAAACSGAGGPRTTPTAPAPPAPASAADTKTPDAASKFGLGFVLLDKAVLPDVAAVIAEYQELAPTGPSLGSPEVKDGIVSFSHGESFATVALMPTPVPDGEAEHHAQFSIMSLAGKWKIAPHGAHLMVVTMYPGSSALERTRTAHRLIAAVTAAAGSNAVGVYVGSAGVTHEPAFYVEAVGDTPDAMMVWSGVSVARTGDRMSLLSTGMKQLDLPEVELTAETTPPGEALAALYDILLYVAKRGERLPEGDTIGQSAEQRIPVRYVPSPVDASVQIMRVDYP